MGVAANKLLSWSVGGAFAFVAFAAADAFVTDLPFSMAHYWFAMAPWALASLAVGVVGAWLWTREFGPTLIVALSGVAGAFLLLGLTELQTSELVRWTYSIAAVAVLAFTAAPWFAMRRVITARAGRGDGAGGLDFFDGSHGRSADTPVEGDFIAWRLRGSRAGGYRDDGDATRYRVVPGTRQDFVQAARRKASLGVLGASSILAILALIS